MSFIVATQNGSAIHQLLCGSPPIPTAHPATHPVENDVHSYPQDFDYQPQALIPASQLQHHALVTNSLVRTSK